MRTFSQLNTKVLILIAFCLVLALTCGVLFYTPLHSIVFWFRDAIVLAQSFSETSANQPSSFNNSLIAENIPNQLLIIQDNSLLPIAKEPPGQTEVTAKSFVILTGYSSTPWQTDETPFIAASGAYVYDGVAANNFLPFGTKFRVPEIFGDKIFTVEDRLNPRQGSSCIDIWFTSTEAAFEFGVKWGYIEILKMD